MRSFIAALMLLAIGNSALAGYIKIPITDFQGNQSFEGGHCTLAIDNFGSDLTFDFWINPASENSVSRHDEIYVRHGLLPKVLPPEIGKIPGSNSKEDVSYDNGVLTLRRISSKWNGQQNDPQYFRYTRVVQIGIAGEIKSGHVTSLKYTFTNESAGEASWTESMTCTKN